MSSAKISDENIPLLNIMKETTDITTEILRRSEAMVDYANAYASMKTKGISFSSINIYENPYIKGEPCFPASQVFKFIENGDNITRSIKKNYIEGYHYFTARVVDNKTQAPTILTRRGLMKVVFSGKSAIALAFQAYVFDLLDALWEKNKKEIYEAMEALEIKYAEEIKRGDSLDAANFSMNQKIMEQHQITNLMLNDDDPRDSDIKELHILRELLMKPLYIYIVSPEYVKTPEKKVEKKEAKKEPRKSRVKKIKMSTFGMSDDSDSPIDYESDNQPVFESEFEYDHETYNHMSITIRDLEYNPEKLYYMFVSKTKLKEAKNYKLIHALKIYTKNDSEKTHYNMMIEIIKKGSIDEFPETFENPEPLQIMSDKELLRYTKNMSDSESRKVIEAEKEKAEINMRNASRLKMYNEYVKNKIDNNQKEEKENITETGVKIGNHSIYEISYNTLLNARNTAFTKLHKDKLSNDYSNLKSPIYF